MLVRSARIAGVRSGGMESWAMQGPPSPQLFGLFNTVLFGLFHTLKLSLSNISQVSSNSHAHLHSTSQVNGALPKLQALV